MPKILIKEFDKTKSGTPSTADNYTVLVAGLRGRTPNDNDEIKPDSNDVYEFTSADDFKNTVGLSIQYGDSANAAYCYGGQMAYELLKMGYPVIYLPVDKASDLADESKWEIFKDKVNYDFRFITHGLLSSSLSDSTDYNNLTNRLAEVKSAIAVLEEIKVAYPDDEDATPDIKTELLDARTEALQAILGDDTVSYPGLFDSETKLAYTDYDTAVEKTEAEKNSLEASITTIESNQITEGLINRANGCIANLAMYKANTDGTVADNSGRGDCIALIELDENSYNSSTTKPEKAIANAIDRMSSINSDNGPYWALTVPSVVYKMSYDTSDEQELNIANNKKFPGAFHYLACFNNSLSQGFREWYAAAGYTRGVASYVIDHTTVKLGEIAINELEPRSLTSDKTSPKFACNVIANFRGSYYLWGNRTAAKLNSDEGTTGDLTAKHFLNIRQLCTTLKKQLYVACRRFTFDPNSDTLWVNFYNAIKPTLEAMKADQGIRDYKILKVYTDKKATLKAKIRIIPIEAVEDFDLEVYLEDSFGETIAVPGDIQ